MPGPIPPLWTIQKSWDNRDYFGYNLDKAKEYLAKWEQETGKKASDLKLRIILQNEDDANAIALSVQSDVGALTGNPLCVEITSYDRATFTAAKKDPAHRFVGGRQPAGHPQPLRL